MTLFPTQVSKSVIGKSRKTEKMCMDICISGVKWKMSAQGNRMMLSLLFYLPTCTSDSIFLLTFNGVMNSIFYIFCFKNCDELRIVFKGSIR